MIVTDDKPGYRNLISGMLNLSQVTVIAEAEDGKQLLKLLNRLQPDIVLLDLEMPVMDGNKAFDLVHTNFPDIKVIILSFYSQPALIEHYLKRGAKGYITKDSLDAGVLMEALTEIRNEGIYRREIPSGRKMYTERQEEIMPLIFAGLTNKEIGDEIYITERAVEKQRKKIYERSGAERAIDFYKYAFTCGLQFLGRIKPSKKSR